MTILIFFEKNIDLIKIIFFLSSTEIAIHKEQLKQHSITIVNFEKEVNRLKKKENEYTNKIDSLEKKLRETATTNARSTTTTTARSFSSSPPTLHTSSTTHQALTTETFNNESLNRTIELLR